MPQQSGQPYAYFACDGLSYTTRGPSGTWYEFKQGVPLPVRNRQDVNKFRGQWDVLYECTVEGQFVPTHPDDVAASRRDSTKPLSLTKMVPPGTITSSDVIRPPEPTPALPPSPPPTMADLRPSAPAGEVAVMAASQQVIMKQDEDEAQKAAVPVVSLDDDPEIAAMEARKAQQKVERAEVQKGRKKRKRR